MVRADLKLTAADYRTLPETGPRYQLIDGELIRMTPAPNTRHQVAVTRFVRVLGDFVEEKGLGVVLVSPVDVYLSEHDVVQPDVIFVSNARRDRIAEHGIEGAPDLVIEVLSRSTRGLDLGAKKALYARHGLIELWALDFDREVVDVYRLQEDPSKPARTVSREEALTSELFPGLAIDLRRIFASV